MPGYAFHVGEVIARGQHVRVDMDQGTGCTNDVADAVGAFDRTTQHITTGLDRSRPRDDHGSEHEIGSRLKAFPSALFDQFIPDPTEAVPRLVVAKPRAG